MVVITDITVPADQFALGRLFDEYPEIEIELERIVPLQTGVIPLFWVDHDDRAVVEETLRADPLTESAKCLTQTDGRYLFEIRWSQEIDSIIQPLIDTHADVLRAEGTIDAWEFRLQFNDRNHLTDFREQCLENDIQIELRRLYNPNLPAEESTLTDEQYDIISTAYTHGYWSVPRGVTLGELANLTGISDNAASQRLRRGLNAVVGEFLASENG
ncbi:helix-turn-helix domain-containing protein [Halorussus salinisoli]|uniref:helix-turn-helix domain-containing protein n=1 Tax=Halorussus salinisoli TaxID=2558242 RepID=UPI0010C1BCFE|nr:helix-turn-helix domain-containing protein [Halorussus salinisoli]